MLANYVDLQCRILSDALEYELSVLLFSDNASVRIFTWLQPWFTKKSSHLQLFLFLKDNISNNIQGSEYKRQHQK